MGNMCCKREMYAPNGTDTDQSRCNNQQQQNGNHQQHLLSKHQHPAVMSSAYHSAGDDCAINELLEGRMDLDVLLPDGRKVRLTVERRTPMMDLLVQAASATKISPGGHVIHVFGEGDKGRGALQYKPSTPIGTLDTKTICIVPKKESSDPLARKLGKTANRPFEPTFRVQVHLPRNQLTVLRVSPRIKISELKSMVCKEKGLDMNRYQLVRPSGPTQPLSGDMTLADYGSTEITLLSNSSIEAHICNSNSHIIPYSKRPEEPKRRTGILRLLTEDANNKVNETANCKSISQVDSYQRNKANKSEEANVHQNRYKPKKRRPAPPPPPPVLPEAPSHSRQSSSDSSGYHEATSSFLHEEHSGEEKASSDSSGVSSLGAKDPPLQPSPPPIPNSKKKKAPAPPPPPPPTVQKEKTTHRPAPKSPSSIQQGLVAPKVSAKEVTIIEAEDSGNKIKAELQEKTVHVENNSMTSDINAKDSVVLSQQTVEKKISCESNQESSKAPSMVKEFTISPYSTSKGNSKLKADFQVKTVDVENISVTSDVGAKDSVILLKQIVENKLSCESSQKSNNDPSLVKEFTISPYSTSKNNPIIQDNAAVLEDNLMKEDCLTQKNNNNNNNIFRDQIPNTNHAIVKDQVLKQDAEGKLDLLRLRESEGQPLVTVAAKVLPTANVSADTIKEKQSSRVETSPVKEIRETSSFVPDVHRSRTPENKVEKERVPRKGEAVSTRVALVALNARIEQDVTQQEIASSIQAAFHSVDCSPQPSLLSIKQRSADDSNVQITRDRSLGPFESIPPKTTTTVKVPLNLDTVNKSSVRASPEITRKFGDLEREALLIDEEPLPRPASSGCAFTKNLRRSSSLLNFADTSHRNSSYANNKRSRHLQRSLSDLSTDEKEDFETEQERLHREYIKLQRQFILWQQQLMNNHAMLREECIVPQYARTLRQSHSLPEGEDSFEEVTPSVPLVSRSLSYEPTKDRCSTLPRSAINITSLELGSIPIGNGTSTLRSSKTKSYFKPPQVRISTKSRQRLPPEIKKEGDVDITDDTKMLTTILPSFESLKLITENNDEDSLSNGVSRLKDMNPVTKHTPTEGRKVPVVHLSSTFPKMNTRLNNGDKSADSNLKYVNGDSGQSKPQTDCSKATVQQSQQKSQPPPPPPPVPTFGMSKSSVKEGTKSTGQRNGVERRNVALEVDPREQLMLEIRKFGGRTALRKISLAS